MQCRRWLASLPGAGGGCLMPVVGLLVHLLPVVAAYCDGPCSAWVTLCSLPAVCRMYWPRQRPEGTLASDGVAGLLLRVPSLLLRMVVVLDHILSQ